MTFLNDKAWWYQMLSSLIGSALGVAMTFATSALINQQEKEKLARRMTAITINQIGEHLEEMEGVCEELNICDSLFAVMNELYPKKLARVDNDELLFFVAKQFPVFLPQQNDAAAQAFNQNVDVWKTMDDLRVHRNIVLCLSLQSRFYRLYDQLTSRRDEILRPFWNGKYLKDYNPENPVEIVTDMMKTPGFRNFRMESNMMIMAMNGLVQALKVGYENVKLRTGITDEELDRLYRRNSFEDEFSTEFRIDTAAHY